MSFYPPLDVSDPQTFIAGLVAVLARYPDELMDKAVAPGGLPLRIKTLRNLADVEEVCRDLYEPILRRLTREELANRPRALPRPPRSPEEQAAIDAQVERWKRPAGEGGS